MLKKKVLFGIGIFLVAIALLSATIFAFSSKIKLSSLSKEKNTDKLFYCITETDTSVSKDLSENIINTANSYINNISINPTIMDLSSTRIILKTDNTVNEKFYEVTNTYYTISLKEDLTLRSFSDEKFDYNLRSKSDKSLAEKYILNVYNNLKLEKDYDLKYLEQLDEVLWEADFVKNCDGLYNYYDSIKIFFSPEQEKIAALRIHNTEYKDNQKENISENKAKEIVIENFEDITSKNITDVQLTLTKPNNMFERNSSSDIVSQNIVKKAWKVTVDKDSTISYIFVDIDNGEIIGGDQIK